MKFKSHRGYIGPVDNYRRERLLELSNLIESNEQRSLKLNFPDYQDLEPARQRDLTDPDSLKSGQGTVLFSLPAMLAEHSQLIKNGVPVINSTRFQDLDVPVLDRSLEAAWGGSSVDVGDNGISAALPKPKRVSAFIVVSRQLQIQNPILTGAWLESQLLAAVGRALDKAAIVGDGTGDNPLGILNDTEILTHTRTSAGINTLTDMAAMERTIAEANGEASSDDYFWVSDPRTREALRIAPAFTAEGNFGDSLWSHRTSSEKSGPLGFPGIVSPVAPADTFVLAQSSGMAFVDWNKLEVENLTNVYQATEGFRTMLATGFFDFVTIDPKMICKAVDA